MRCTEADPGACGGTDPSCDGESNVCITCSEHAQCGDAACNFYTGLCLPQEAIVHVGPGLKLETLAAAVADPIVESEGTIIVHQAIYADEIDITGGRVLAFIAHEDDRPVWENIDGNGQKVPQLAVGNGAAILDGLELSDRVSGPAIEVTGGNAHAWVDRSHINNRGGGILVQNNADVTLRNCFVGGDAAEGNVVNDVNAVTVNDASATIIYSTLISGPQNAYALLCSNPDSVMVRNSLIVAEGDPDLWGGVDVDCGGVDMTYTVTESEIFGFGNQSFGQMPSPDAWFVEYLFGDFHLQNDSLMLFADVARWQAGDPLTDIDGDPRPAMIDAADFVGADVP